ARTVLAVELPGIRPLSGTRSGRCEDRLIPLARLHVGREFRIGGEGVGPEAGRCQVGLLGIAKAGGLALLGRDSGLRLPAKNGRKLAFQLDETLTFLYPLGRRVGPVRALSTERVPLLESREGLHQLALLPKDDAKVAMGRGQIGI